MCERIELEERKQLELLKKIVKRIFGYDTKIDFSKWELEADQVRIVDIDWDEDLLTVLQRLREDFYVLVEPETEEVEIEDIGEVKSQILNVTLIVKGD
ncbi:MAG: hypothetical protein DRN81_03685 [Thermoproteota archaeon]|nr:MAG: hypothetical protein DRN81_03685 [Candidatus Korarchaeota archaeon]